MGIVEVLGRAYRLGREMHPALTANSLKHRVMLMGHALAHFQDVCDWYETSDNPLLTQALNRFPLMHGAMYWPYINRTWTMSRRLAVIDQHYRMLGAAAAIIAKATQEEVELARLEEAYPGLRLVLDKASWFLREGEIVINLFVGDRRLYSIAFTLGLEAGKPLLFVGALQGSNAEDALGAYRDITHALHGMRPRDFLMVALKLLCAELEIQRIWAVCGEDRQHNSAYFGGSHTDKVLADYDTVWIEHGGALLDNGFFEIPAMYKHKDMSEIPSRKRATYRRRYQMLDDLAQGLKAVCARHAARPAMPDVSAVAMEPADAIVLGASNEP